MNSENVFKVCDEPHPVLVKDMLMKCVSGDISSAYKVDDNNHFLINSTTVSVFFLIFVTVG